MAIDAAVAVAAMALGWLILSGSRADWPADARDPDVLAAVLVVGRANATIASAPPCCRRGVGDARSSVGTHDAARQYPPMASPVVPLIVYMAATRLDARQSRLVLIVAAVAAWVGTTVAAGPTELDAVLIVAGGWLLGHYVRTRRLLVAELEQRAADLERQREQQAGRAVAEERLRIARELHDVLAHTMSVVALCKPATGPPVGAEHPDAAIAALAGRGDDSPIGDGRDAPDPHRAARRRGFGRRSHQPPVSTMGCPPSSPPGDRSRCSTSRCTSMAKTAAGAHRCRPRRLPHHPRGTDPT